VATIESTGEKALGKGGEAVLARALSDLLHLLRAFLAREQGEVVDTSTADTAELETLQKSVTKAEAAVAEARKKEEGYKEKLSTLRAAEQAGVQKNQEAERLMFTLLNEQRELENTLRLLGSELAVLERDRTDFKQQLQEAVALLGRGAMDYYTVQVLGEAGESLADEIIASEERSIQRTRQHELEKLKIRLEELGVGATEDLLKEYTDARERDEFLARELADLETSVENLKALTVDMQGKLQEQFAVGLEKITKEFNTFFTLMFGGGAAALERVKLKTKGGEEEGEVVEESEVQEGVEIALSLPNKRVKGLEMLSGGERALTSIALIFAMSQVNPPPFIILDETDAALDEANSRRYGDMIEALAKRSQLVLITHNRETMSRAGVLYGITMGIDGVSKVLSVKFDEAAAVAK
jgi:chromosome segregation protein